MYSFVKYQIQSRYCDNILILQFADNSWDLDNPVIVCLSKLAVMDMTEARGKLWCASGNFIYILDIETLGTEVSFLS